jgi:hypothetical protein
MGKYIGWWNKKKNLESTQLNFNNMRPKIWDRDNLTKRKAKQTTLLRSNKSMSNDENKKNLIFFLKDWT